MKFKTLLLTTLLLLVLICIMLPQSIAQSPVAVNIIPRTTQLSSAQIGNIIEVQLSVDNVQNLFGWNLNLTWNPQVLNLTNIQEGPFLSNAGSTLCTWGPSLSPTSRSQGYLNSTGCILLEAQSVDGSGVLATLSFQIIGTGVSPVSIEGTQLINPSPTGVLNYIPVTLNSGTITIIRSDNNSSINSAVLSDNNSHNRPANTSNNNPETNSDNNPNSPADQAHQNPSLTTQFPLKILGLVSLIIVVVLILSAGILILHKNILYKLNKK